MKKVLAISVVLNVMLFGWVIALKCDDRLPLSVSKNDFAKVLPAGSTNFQPSPFRWSQIESTDYPTYVSNLRAIGCPEQTIRDIIVAAVGSLYATRREQLENEEGRKKAQDLTAALNRLRSEEGALLAALLGTQTSSTRASKEEASARNRFKALREEAAISIPLVFQNVGLSRLKLDSDQIEIINQLRQRFVEQVGDPNSDGVAYRERWQKAQPDCDEMFRGFIGVNAYQDYQIAAMTSSENFQPTP